LHRIKKLGGCDFTLPDRARAEGEEEKNLSRILKRRKVQKTYKKVTSGETKKGPFFSHLVCADS
jgi:hypothetical protein